MKTKLLPFIVIIGFLFLGGTVQAQQEKGREDLAGTGQLSAQYDSYMGGKEHYLPNSPFYMAGKRHYLQTESSSNSGETASKNEENSTSKNEMQAAEREEPEQQGGPQIQIEINNVPEETAGGYGLTFLPRSRHKHPPGTVNPLPKVDSNPPNVGGGFQSGSRFSR